MLDLRYIRENLDEVRESVTKRGLKVDLARFLVLDKERSELIQSVETLRSQTKPEGKPTPEELKKLQDLKKTFNEKQLKLDKVEEEFEALYLQIPNLIHPDVPTGDESKGKELKKVGEPPKFSFKPLDHLELGKRLDLLDFDRAAKVTGSRFYYLKNEAVELELALIRYVMDILRAEGFIFMDTPDLARNEILDGIGFAPRGNESNVYNIEGTDLSLSATAEITLGGYHSDEILDHKALPLKYAGLSRCFRREGGTYGQESKGLYRVHQFTKLEMFIYCLPSESAKLHDYLLELEEKVFSGLGFAYRVLDVASGDLGASAYRKYDVEVWMPGRDSYGEVTSTSNTTDFQARRLSIRFRNSEGRLEFAHTLNGTAIAVNRPILAILENYQQSDGSVKIPAVLHPYLSFKEILPKTAGKK
jgi:seryl-tRNA synthetase